MGLLNRALQAIRANVNHWIEATEDPEKVLAQTVAEMQSELLVLRRALAQAIATQKRVERQQLQNQAFAEDYQRRAQLALERGDEPLAREALTHRQTYLKTALVLQGQLQQQSASIGNMRKHLRQLEAALVEARMKQEMYSARLRSAQAMRKLHELTEQPKRGSSLNVFDRMEDKVTQLEAEAQLLDELSNDESERQFAALEDAEAIEAELRAMKNRTSSSFLQGQ